MISEWCGWCRFHPSSLFHIEAFLPNLENIHTFGLAVNYNFLNNGNQTTRNTGTNKTSVQTCVQLWYEGVMFLLCEGLQNKTSFIVNPQPALVFNQRAHSVLILH